MQLNALVRYDPSLFAASVFRSEDDAADARGRFQEVSGVQAGCSPDPARPCSSTPWFATIPACSPRPSSDRKTTLLTLAGDFKQYLAFKPDAPLILQGHAAQRPGSLRSQPVRRVRLQIGRRRC